LKINHSKIFILPPRKVKPISYNFKARMIVGKGKIIFISPGLALFLAIYTNFKPISNPYEIIFITSYGSRLITVILNDFNFFILNIKQKRPAFGDINPPGVACRIFKICCVSKFVWTVKTDDGVEVGLNEGDGLMMGLASVP
jgi:hypothetical protein